jgi:hypothetical protein
MAETSGTPAAIRGGRATGRAGRTPRRTHPRSSGRLDVAGNAHRRFRSGSPECRRSSGDLAAGPATKGESPPRAGREGPSNWTRGSSRPSGQVSAKSPYALTRSRASGRGIADSTSISSGRSNVELRQPRRRGNIHPGADAREQHLLRPDNRSRPATARGGLPQLRPRATRNRPHRPLRPATSASAGRASQPSYFLRKNVSAGTRDCGG